MFRCTVHSLNHVFSVNDGLNVLRNGCVRPYVTEAVFRNPIDRAKETYQSHSCP